MVDERFEEAGVYVVFLQNEPRSSPILQMKFYFHMKDEYEYYPEDPMARDLVYMPDASPLAGEPRQTLKRALKIGSCVSDNPSSKTPATLAAVLYMMITRVCRVCGYTASPYPPIPGPEMCFQIIANFLGLGLKPDAMIPVITEIEEFGTRIADSEGILFEHAAFLHERQPTDAASFLWIDDARWMLSRLRSLGHI